MVGWLLLGAIAALAVDTLLQGIRAWRTSGSIPIHTLFALAAIIAVGMFPEPPIGIISLLAGGSIGILFPLTRWRQSPSSSLTSWCTLFGACCTRAGCDGPATWITGGE